MKWINMSEREPEGLVTYTVLRVGDKQCIFMDVNSIRGTGDSQEYHIDTYNWQEWVLKSKIEWLDESEQSIEESRCCEQNDKLRAEIYKLSGIEEDKPLGDHFNAIKNKLGRLVSEIEMDYMRYRDSKMSYRNFINKWL